MTESGKESETPEDIAIAIENVNDLFNDENIYFYWNCSITYLEYQNNSGTATTQILNNSDFMASEDAIDVIIFTKDIQSSGFTCQVPGTILLVGGSSLDPRDGTSAIKDGVLAHEFGHCLGLAHPSQEFEYGPTNPDNSNGETSGDCIFETPPSLILNSGSIDLNCNYTGNSSYNPHIQNVMNLYPKNCGLEFIPEQGTRMRNTIDKWETEFNDAFLNHDITSNTTWSQATLGTNIRVVPSDIRVLSGVTLTIESDVEVQFGNNARLLIDPGAEVIVRGTLTSLPCDCYANNYCGETWLGARVYGNVNNSQFVVPGQTPQGKITLEEGSVIENALIGIQTGGKALDQGGIIIADGATFINNKTAIDFVPYKNFWPFALPPGQQGQVAFDLSYIKNCSFETNEDYPHLESLRAFISMTGVRGIEILGSSFINAFEAPSPDDILDHGYGIKAIDAQFSVLPVCSGYLEPNGNCIGGLSYPVFSGLGYGIFSGMAIDPLMTFSVEQATFENCYVGIHNRSVTASKIVHNTFDFTDYPGSYYPGSTQSIDDQIGVALTGGISGISIEENSFINGQANTLRSIGVHTFNIGAHNNFIRRNSLNSMSIGNQAGGICADLIKGLNYECNFNQSSTEYDFLVCQATDINSIIRDPQSGINGNSSGNIFAYTGQSTNRDFHNEDNSLVRYFYNNTTSETPIDYSGILIEQRNPNLCKANFCIPACDGNFDVGSAIQDHGNFQSDFLIAISNLNSAQQQGNLVLQERFLSEAIEKKLQMDHLSNLILNFQLNSEFEFSSNIENSFDQQYSWNGDILKALSRFSNDDISGAISLLNNIPTKYHNFPLTSESYNDLQPTLTYLTGKDVYNLSTADLDGLTELVSDDLDFFSRSIIKNILTHHQEDYAAESCDLDFSLNRSTGSLVSKNAMFQIENITLAPNPGNEYVKIIGINDKSCFGNLTFYDLSGRLVLFKKLMGNCENINIESLISGVYIYRFIDEKNDSFTGKFTLIHE